MDDNEIVEKRKRALKSFFKERYDWVVYVILAFIVFLSVRIRTLNIPGLKDITTGTWTLGPDLDPYLFLRWAKYIVEHGTLFAVDKMRYSPLGLNVEQEYLLHPYMIAWFHKIATIFGSGSVTYSAIIYPVFMFALTTIAFFLFSREALIKFMGKRKADIGALVASLFFVIIPVFIPRTIAGIPEKESVAFLFMFLTYFFFLKSWNTDKKNRSYIYAALAGLATVGMANVWGGYLFIFLAIPPTFLVAFLVGKVGKKEAINYSIWLVVSLVLMNLTSISFSYSNLARSFYTSSAIFTFITLVVYLAIYNTKLKEYVNRTNLSSKIPPQTISFSIALVLSILLSIGVFGFSLLESQINNIKDNLLKPATSRLIQTVAENKQPFFTEWSGNFGPRVGGIDLSLWIAVIGVGFMVFNLFKNLGARERNYLTGSYIFLVLAILLSRYSGNSMFNGQNFVSDLFYFGGFILAILVFGYVYFANYKKDKFEKLKQINFGIIFILLMFLFSLIAARGAIRLVMVIVPPLAILIGYIVASIDYHPANMKNMKSIVSIILLIFIIFSAFIFYVRAKQEATNYVPSIYNQQWQKAMAWVRENTSENAVFAHWWDYGYWIQSIGERATVLDGGNNIPYWNHMMGSYVLTGEDKKQTLDFLYAHNVTHLLIDSTDLGKYSAYSFIGSDVDLDRSSYIPMFLKNSDAGYQTKNNTGVVYQGGFSLDQDLIYDMNGTRIFLPAQKAGIGAVILEYNSEGKLARQPQAIAVYQGKQYSLPMRYAFDGELKDFGSGIGSGFMVIPSGTQNSNGISLDPQGALIYLSPRTIKTNFARYYLYGEENENIKIALKEDDFLIAQLKAQNPSFSSDFIYFYGFRGPIKIWDITYPRGTMLNESYLETHYPEELYKA